MGSTEGCASALSDGHSRSRFEPSSIRTCRLQDRTKCGDDPIGLVGRQHEARRDDHVLVDAAHDHALLVSYPVGDLLPRHLERVAGLLVRNELNRGQQARPADVADDLQIEQAPEAA